MTTSLAWITGASSGIGAALARTVPLPDPHVIDLSRSGGTPGTEHVPADLATPEGWRAVAAHFAERLASFEGERVALVHAAGTLTPIGFAGEVDDHAYEHNVVLNSAAPQVLGHAFIRAVRDAGFGGRADLVILSSGAARKPYPGWSSYSAGKAAVDAWVSAVGQEQDLRGGRIRVISATPGTVATPMQAEIRETPEEQFPARQKFIELYESGSLRDPDDAAMALWGLLDDDLDNGAVVDIRGR